MLDRITPFVLTFNEEANIERTLDALSWAREVVVVDSGSTDSTLRRAAGYSNVRIVHRTFDSHAAQFNFALGEAGIESEWVLALDADYVVTRELRQEIASLPQDEPTNGYRVRFVYCVQGVALRASLYPPVTVLYRRRHAHYVQDGHTQRVRIDGEVRELRASMLHDDRKGLDRWLWSQHRYMRLEADVLANTSWSQLKGSRRLRKLIVVSPIAIVLWCLFGKGLLLEGWRGLFYTLQRGMAESLLSLEQIRRRLARSRAER